MVQENLQEKVLKRIKPSQEEIRASHSLAGKIIKEIQKEGYEAVLVGSRARGTFISGERDIDIFTFFPLTTPREDLERKGLELGKKILKAHKPTTHYAEHPYTKANVSGIDIEIVPCYKITKNQEIISSVDRTPLHNEYLLKKLTEKHKEEVILLKQFLKASGLYGADQKTKGFSGYLCELLTLNYGTFDKIVNEAANKWNKRIVIDMEKHAERFDKFSEVLVVIDPVDRTRNVASAVSRDTLSYFILKCRDYLKNPSEEHFFPTPKKLNLKEMIKGRRMILLTFNAPDVIPEILWSQLEALTKKIKETLYENEFEAYRAEYWTDEKTKCVLMFELNTYDLGKYKRHKGPEVWDSEHCESFTAKNPMWWVQRSVLEAWKERKFNKAVDVIRDTIEHRELVPSHLQSVIWSAKIIPAEKAHKETEAMKKYFTTY